MAGVPAPGWPEWRRIGEVCFPSISISIHRGPGPPAGHTSRSYIYIERRDTERYREKNGRQRQGLRRAKENVIHRRQSALVLQTVMLQIIPPFPPPHSNIRRDKENVMYCIEGNLLWFYKHLCYLSSLPSPPPHTQTLVETKKM